MRRARTKAKTGDSSRVALALTWDGSRCSPGGLPREARAFLQGRTKAGAAPSREELAELFAQDAVREIRVCWVPRLSGGDGVLCDPFEAADGRRVVFCAGRPRRFGDVLGVVYRRAGDA